MKAGEGFKPSPFRVKTSILVFFLLVDRVNHEKWMLRIKGDHKITFYHLNKVENCVTNRSLISLVLALFFVFKLPWKLIFSWLRFSVAYKCDSNISLFYYLVEIVVCFIENRSSDHKSGLGTNFCSWVAEKNMLPFSFIEWHTSPISRCNASKIDSRLHLHSFVWKPSRFLRHDTSWVVNLQLSFSQPCLICFWYIYDAQTRYYMVSHNNVVRLVWEYIW